MFRVRDGTGRIYSKYKKREGKEKVRPSISEENKGSEKA